MENNHLKISVINFTTLKYCGCWRPLSMNNKFRKFIYYLYSCLVLSVIVSLTLQKCVVIPTTTSNLDEFIDHLFPFIEILCTIAKGFNFLFMQRKIELAVQSMTNNNLYNRPIDQLEADWKTTTEQRSRFVTVIKSFSPK